MTPEIRNAIVLARSENYFGIMRTTLFTQFGIAAVSAADASRDADIVITVLPAPPHVEAAVFGEDGVAETIGEGAILIQQSTVDPAAVKDLARRLGLQGVQVLDAPMLRNPAAAAAGTLGFVVGGDEAAFARAMPIFDCMGESAEHVGPVGTG